MFYALYVVFLGSAYQTRPSEASLLRRDFTN